LSEQNWNPSRGDVLDEEIPEVDSQNPFSADQRRVLGVLFAALISKVLFPSL